jgi:exopolysaccharide biosynthesis protein
MRYKRIIAKTVAALFIASLAGNNTYLGVNTYTASAAANSAKSTTTSIYDNNIGMGINYSKKIVTDGSIKKVLNILNCDLNNYGANIVFSKAKDIERKEQVLSKQVQRENYKGNNVVAAINADMFDMGIGYSSGPQIRNGTIITNHNAKYEENVYPVFGIDNNKKAFINYVHMDARVSLGTTTEGAINITTNGTYMDANSISIDSVNRENCKDKLVLIDYQLNQTKKIDITPSISKGISCITYVKGIEGPVKLGTEYEGIVETVGLNAKTSNIPTDGILLCSTGTKANWMSKNLKAGDKIKVQVNYDKPDISEAIGAYSYFVRNGKVLTNDEMIKAGAKADLVKARKARTAIGITSDNKVIAIAVDGGTPSKGISDGITLYEMANLLKSMGAVDAVAFDGGGSTQMNAKLYGESSVSILTKPSDGRERALTNGIMFVSNNERTYQVKSISIDGTGINIFKNATYKFKAKGMDTNFNRLDLSNASMNWTADASVGTIKTDGTFTAGNLAGSGKVAAKIGSNSASAAIKVFNDIPSLKLTDTKTVAIQKGVLRQFNIDAKDTAGKSVIIGSTQVKWAVSNNMGTIDKNGLLTVTAKAGSGVVTATVGSKKASVAVTIMPDYKLIDDFEHNDLTRYLIDGTIGGNGSIATDNVKSGKYSYKVSYDYDGLWDRTGTGNIIIMPTFFDKNQNDTYANYTSSLKPKKLGLWIYGDGQAPLLRAQFTDNDDNNRIIDIAKTINWTGWKYVTVDIPSDIPSPITLEALSFQESNKTLHKKGTIYFDDIKYIYSDSEDNSGPSFLGFYPAKNIYTKDTEVRVKISDPSGVEKKSIWAKLDGNNILTEFDENTGILSYNAKALNMGVHSFEVKAMDGKGNSVNPPYVAKFTISSEVDTIKPVITGLLPGNNSVVKTSEPRISVKIKDDKSGINAADINILLDGIKLKTYFDEDSGYASAAPLAASASASPTTGITSLSAGKHTIAISVKDRAGNKAVLQTTSFTVIPVIQPKNSEDFSVSVLSDSHATEFGYKLFEEVKNNESELVLQNGDLIDKDSSAQWAEGVRQLALVKNKQVMITPGNHEGSSGNNINFTKNFGLPAYSFLYGNSLFIALNSSISQSISASDPTQFEYLKDVLDRNKKQNVFIYTHVPTRDNQGIKHALPDADVKKLEGILTNYKKQNNNKTVNVIFGHMHSFQSWSVGGVNYTIDGNECLKKYVNPDAGGYMGYTKFIVKASAVTRRFMPMPDGISITDSALVNGEMKLIKGSRKKLNVYGDFSYSTADYIALLNNIADVDIAWESDNPEIVSVSQDGIINTKAVGSANIKAVLNKKTVKLKVTSIEPVDAYISGFKAISDSSNLSTMTAEKKLKLSGNGYDIYGNSFLIDNNMIHWTCSNGSIANGSYTPPAGVTTEQAITITAVFKNSSSTISFVLKPGTANAKIRYVTITSSTLNIRDNPSTNGNIIGNLIKGDKVEVVGEENGWLIVNVKDRKGYISKAYTKEN